MDGKKKIILLVSAGLNTSKRVIELVKEGYAVECTANGYDAIERVMYRKNDIAAMVIEPEIIGLDHGELLSRVSESGIEKGELRRAIIPVVCISNGLIDPPQVIRVANVANTIGAIKGALKSLISQP